MRVKMAKKATVTNSRFRISGLDLRALSAFRILVGLNVIYNLIKYRFFAGSIYYTSDGIKDPIAAKNFYGELFSLINIVPSDAFVLFFLSFTFLLALLYTLGVKARWIAPLLFFCFGNIVVANPWTVHAVEFLIEASLFWSIFLPIDHYFAILPAKEKIIKGNELRNFPAFALLIQIFYVYFTSGITKSGEYWREGLTVLSVMDDRMHSAFLADWFAAHPGLCEFLTHSTVYVEVLMGLLLFSPLFNKQLRLVIAIGIPALHFGLAMGMDVGPFHWITLAFAIVILPDFVWDAFMRLLGIKTKTSKGKKKTKTPLKTSPLWQTWAVRIFLSAVLIIITIQNLKKWQRDSYFSSAVINNPVLNGLANIDLPNPPLFIGLWNQPWWTFSPNPHEQMGCLLMLGRKADNSSVDLVSGRTVSVTPDPNTGRPIFSEPPHNQFKRTHFVFAWYARRYLSTMPKPLLKRWLDVVTEEYNREHPNDQVTETGLFFFSNQTDLVNGQITRVQDFAQVQF